jgi:hypothetical protein
MMGCNRILRLRFLDPQANLIESDVTKAGRHKPSRKRMALRAPLSPHPPHVENGRAVNPDAAWNEAFVTSAQNYQGSRVGSNSISPSIHSIASIARRSKSSG